MLPSSSTSPRSTALRAMRPAKRAAAFSLAMRMRVCSFLASLTTTGFVESSRYLSACWPPSLRSCFWFSSEMARLERA